jgi:predicted glycogen debranching enzyme
LVNHVEEWLDIEGTYIPLSTNVYDGALYPEGFRNCADFSSEPWPTWRYEVHGLCVVREVLCPHGRDAVILRWRLIAPSGGVPVTLHIRPMLSGRPFHSAHHENSELITEAQIDEQEVSWQPYRNVPRVHAAHNGIYVHAPDWYRRIQYPVEQERGLDHEEDWWSPGEFRYVLTTGQTAEIVFATDAWQQSSIEQALSKERQRRHSLRGDALSEDPLIRTLWIATDSYLASRGENRTVLAGFPWFADWGRDTFISLPGLCLVTGRHKVAWQVIEAFAGRISAGMVPNRFPDSGSEPEYNSIDASLWFIHAVDRYVRYTNDVQGVRPTIWPAIKEIVDAYRRGTRFGIHMDSDGLITGGGPSVQLTWMDVKIGDWVVTPRHGKPVEVQALWVRALEAAEGFAMRYGEPEYAAHCRKDRACAIESFRRRFWYSTGGYLFDVIDGPTGDDASLRPNQVYALALSDDLVDPQQARRMLHIIDERLRTPLGLRTLAPEDMRFCGSYIGGVVERDRAYHQGTVWPFLLGPFIAAWIKVHGSDHEVRRQARSFLDGLEGHLKEACIGQISEICDGQAPHHPRGCFAQAWSVAEPLRALVEDLGYLLPSSRDPVVDQ